MHLAVSSSKASSFTLRCCFQLPLFPELLQLGGGVIKVNTGLTLEWLPCQQCTLTKISSSVNKSIPRRQAGSLIGVSQLINETLAEASSNISQLVDAKSDIQVEAEREQKQFKFSGSPRTNSSTPKSNHFTSASRTVEYQTTSTCRRQNLNKGVGLCREKSGLPSGGKKRVSLTIKD